MRDRTPISVRTACVTIVTIVTLMTGCASRAPAPVPTEAERHPRSVAIIPVREAEGVSIDRNSLWFLLYGGVGVVVERVDMAQKRKVFEKRFTDATKWLGPEVTESLRAASVVRGMDAVVLSDIVRSEEDPEDFDYTKIDTTADVVVHARVRDVGLLSAAFSPDYVPKVAVSVLIVGRRSGAVLLDETFQYGAKATRQAFWSVPADDRYRFRNFDTVIEQVALVDEGWHAGARALGQRIAEQLGTSRTR